MNKYICGHCKSDNIEIHKDYFKCYNCYCEYSNNNLVERKTLLLVNNHNYYR